MRTALCCIAKNEDRYLNEWLQYHLKLGFDEIHVYCNEWIPASRFDGFVTYHFIQFEQPAQMKAYQHFIDNCRNDFDFVAFFDCDEFLVLKKHKSVKDFLFGKLHSVAINWVLFGDSGLDDDGSYGTIDRFTMRQRDVNMHVKCIVKMDPWIRMEHPHCPNDYWQSPEGEIHLGPFNENGSDEIAQLNHYFGKTRQEWEMKKARGRCDVIGENRPDSDFDRHNFNEIEDLWAKNFLYGEE